MDGSRAARKLVLAASLGGLLAAAPAAALTIEEALAEAARANPSVLAAREQARAAHEGVPIARAAWLPTVQASAGTRLSRRDSESASVSFFGLDASLFGAGSFVDSSEQRSLDLSYTQNLYRSGADTASLRQAGQQVLQGNARVEQVEQDVLLRVATAYLDVIRAGRAVDLRVASLAAFDERLRQTEAQYRVGDSTNADIAQAQAEREVAASELSGAEADLEVQRALFEALVGLPAEGLEAAGEPAGLPANLEEARSLAGQDRPAVRAAEHAVRAAEQGMRAAWGDIGPRVDVRGTIARTRNEGQASGLSPIRSEDRTVGVQVTVPLYQGGGAAARLRQQRRVLAQMRNERLAAVREAEQRATSAWRNLGAHRRTRDALMVAAEASRAALEAVRSEADIGERTVREVLDAERDLVSRQVGVLSAERDVAAAAYQLLEAVGGLTARRLGVGGVPDLEAEARETGDTLLPFLPEPFE